MRQNILELWAHPGAATRRHRRDDSRDRVFSAFQERLRTLRASAARGIDDWIGALDDSQTRPDRDF